MLQFTPWKQATVILICLLGMLFVAPNFISKERLDRLPGWFPRTQLNLGLDLRGGAHLLLAMETADVRKDWLETLRDDARKRLRDAKIAFTGLGIVNNTVQVRLAKAEDGDAALKELRGLVQQSGNLILGTTVSDVQLTKGEGGVITITPTDPGLQNRISDAIGAAIETVRRRVDALGTTEPTIVRQGTSRILVQVPGLQDTAQLKELIGKTARLSFHEVHQTMSAEEARQTRVPAGYKVYPAQDREDGPQLLRDTPVVRGDELKTAQPAFDQRTNEPIISFTFNNSGARKFGTFTKDNVNRPFAILLDDQVISAPVIREPILGGSGQISGNFSVESANQLAIQLRSGALPAKLTIVEERTVGPSLGADSIEAGKLAGIIGGIATIVLTVMAYGTFGLFACRRADRARPLDGRLDGPGRIGAHAARHRRAGARHRHGGRCERADLRAHPRGAARRQDADLGDRCRVHARLHHHRRLPADDAGLRDGHVLAGLRADPRLCGHAHHRHLHVHIRVRDRCAAHHLLLAQFDAADAPHH